MVAPAPSVPYVLSIPSPKEWYAGGVEEAPCVFRAPPGACAKADEIGSLQLSFFVRSIQTIRRSNFLLFLLLL